MENASADDDDDDSEGGMEAEDKKTTNKCKAEYSTAKTLATIADDGDVVLAFLQAVAVKSP